MGGLARLSLVLFVFDGFPRTCFEPLNYEFHLSVKYTFTLLYLEH